MKGTLSLLALLVIASVSYAASFNCDKATSLVEKLICSDLELSKLDDQMTRAYKKELAESANKADAKARQRAWITKERDVCTDVDCIARAYKTRLEVLTAPAAGKNLAQSGSAKNIVIGRCHMGTCWWWKIEKTEVIQSGKKGKLLKVFTTSTSVAFTASQLNKYGYPETPPKNCKWDGVSESYIFCSSRLPLYIEFDKDKNKYVGTVPFLDKDGNTAGATDGVGNLYCHVCNGGEKAHFDVDPGSLDAEIPLEKPTDVFSR